MDILFRPHPSLDKSNLALIRPLWQQRAYFELVKPMLAKAYPQAIDTTSTSYTIAAISAVRFCRYDVYQEDAEQIIRMTITFLQVVPVCEDTDGALDILEQIGRESPSSLESFTDSLCTICVDVYHSRQSQKHAQVSPNVIGLFKSVKRTPPSCRVKVLKLVQLIRQNAGDKVSESLGAKMTRFCALACGDGHREVRGAAIAARQLWTNAE
jgi:DNA repair/transcription protein MET18/MMS19